MKMETAMRLTFMKKKSCPETRNKKLEMLNDPDKLNRQEKSRKKSFLLSNFLFFHGLHVL
jgi:hypothetical protein